MRLYEFESPLALFEDISGEEMLQVFRTMHHDAELNPEMDQYILSHDWELRNFTPDQFPDEEDFFDYDDPFDRVIDIDGREEEVTLFVHDIEPVDTGGGLLRYTNHNYFCEI